MTFLKNLNQRFSNSKFSYYSRGVVHSLIPTAWYRGRLPGILQSLDRREDKEDILRRVDYCCKLTESTPLPLSCPVIGDFKKRTAKMGSVYFYDAKELVHYFKPSFRWNYIHGDNIDIPSVPSIVKSRPIADDNGNAVLLKLNKVRHFAFADDPYSFREKKDMMIFRGKLRGLFRRRWFFERYFGHPLFNLGDTAHSKVNYPTPPDWWVDRMPKQQQMEYKFILSLEGYDVASNLKWIMASNSVAVMPPPMYETWFMEGTLVPDYHYICIRPDYADVEEKITHYIAHPEEAEEIIRHAHEFVSPFLDSECERLVNLLVLRKYFEMTGQE